MSKQKHILNFFKPVAGKRKISDENSEPNVKKQKSEEPEEEANNYEEKAKLKLKELKKELPVMDENMGASWFYALEGEFKKDYFKKLSSFVTSERSQYTVYPKELDVWSWTRFCKLQDVKVVILGQDPYHNPNQAHGLCFSVQKGVQPPPSLMNMYKELENDIIGFKRPGHGDLTHWARQGVLLLNACLTVRKNEPNSHSDKGWEKVTDAVIKQINNKNKGVVFLLWGAYAQKKAALVNKEKHHLLKTVHPSPLSAHRGFFGCRHFSKCNELLEREGHNPISWEFH